MVKCSKAEMRWLKTALRWKIPASQRQRIQMAQRRALSPTFRTGSDAAHYPLAGVGAADSGAALLDRREPLIFLFSKFRCGPIDGARAVELLAATGSLHIGAGRERTGRGAQRRALSPTFRTGSDAAHYPLAGVGAADSGAALLDRREPLIFLFSKFRCGPIDGARAVELLAATGSLHIGAGRERTGRGALHRALSPTFPAGAMVFFIPSRGGAEGSGAAHLDRQTDPHPPPGWCSGC